MWSYLGRAALAGIDPLTYLRANGDERYALDLIAAAALEAQAENEERMAVTIVNTLSKALGG